jgi:hypothetical protein
MPALIDAPIWIDRAIAAARRATASRKPLVRAAGTV